MHPVLDPNGINHKTAVLVGWGHERQSWWGAVGPFVSQERGWVGGERQVGGE